MITLVIWHIKEGSLELGLVRCMVMSHWTFTSCLPADGYMYLINGTKTRAKQPNPPACAEKPDFVWKSEDYTSGSLQDMDKTVFVLKIGGLYPVGH